MRRTQIVLAVALLLLAVLALLLALRNPPIPFLPADADHADGALRACLDCHGPDAALPRSANHPLGDDCFRCHARE